MSKKDKKVNKFIELSRCFGLLLDMNKLSPIDKKLAPKTDFASGGWTVQVGTSMEILVVSFL